MALIALVPWPAECGACTTGTELEEPLQICAATCGAEPACLGYTIGPAGCSLYADVGTLEGVAREPSDENSLYSVLNCERVSAQNVSAFVDRCNSALRCGAITCSDACDYGLARADRECGWFRQSCLPGETTREAQLGKGEGCTTTTTTTTVTTTTTTDRCPGIGCAYECGGECGWNPATYACERGLVTAPADAARSGDCTVRSCSDDPATAFELVTDASGTVSAWFDTGDAFVLESFVGNFSVPAGRECAEACIAAGNDCRGFEVQIDLLIDGATALSSGQCFLLKMLRVVDYSPEAVVGAAYMRDCDYRPDTTTTTTVTTVTTTTITTTTITTTTTTTTTTITTTTTTTTTTISQQVGPDGDYAPPSCNGCLWRTKGPCKNAESNLCFPYATGSTCLATTEPCDPEDRGTCQGTCYPGSSGECQAIAGTLCLPFIPGTTACWAGMAPCGTTTTTATTTTAAAPTDPPDCAVACRGDSEGECVYSSCLPGDAVCLCAACRDDFLASSLMRRRCVSLGPCDSCGAEAFGGPEASCYFEAESGNICTAAGATGCPGGFSPCVDDGSSTGATTTTTADPGDGCLVECPNANPLPCFTVLTDGGIFCINESSGGGCIGGFDERCP